MVFTLVFAMPLTAFADQEDAEGQSSSELQTVRVGYTILPGFQDGAEGEYKSGQGYEYLQKIASYAGWNYEYVYGDFETLYSMLESGDIDLMGDITYTEDRAEKISYGINEQGRESFNLYCSNNDSISAADITTVNGKRLAPYPEPTR